ncbi:hypothetical protein BDW62DRAFT_196633 [Aspergillus aurantiobrunneus]
MSSNPFPSQRDVSYCCPLNCFIKLRQLCINPLLLLSHQCPHIPGTKFASHLPPNLEQFALYGRSTKWIIEWIQHLDAELISIPKASPALPLRCIAVDGPIQPTSGDVPSEPLIDICRSKDIALDRPEHRFYFERGRKTDFAQRTHDAFRLRPNQPAQSRKRKASGIEVPL